MTNENIEITLRNLFLDAAGRLDAIRTSLQTLPENLDEAEILFVAERAVDAIERQSKIITLGLKMFLFKRGVHIETIPADGEADGKSEE